MPRTNAKPRKRTRTRQPRRLRKLRLQKKLSRPKRQKKPKSQKKQKILKRPSNFYGLETPARYPNKGAGREMARLKDKYKDEIVPALAKEFDIKNPMAIPKIEKVVVNMGLGEASANAKILDVATEELKSITG